MKLDFFPIHSIQIQTIDACNSKCIMCPSKSINHTHQEIEDYLFEKLINEIKDLIHKNKIIKNVKILLFAQNEPLLDSKLFKRIDFIKKIIPGSIIRISTNNLLLDKYKNKIVAANFDELYISLYGYDYKSFNKCTQLQINENEYKKITNAINYIKENSNKKIIVDNSWIKDNKTGKMKFQIYSSRAGYYTNKILHKKLTGCNWHRDKGWLMIHANGDVFLCCMDWKKETVYGNIKKMSLENIFRRNKFHEIILKTQGKIPSEKNFICKRCEWAKSSYNEQNEKTLIFTSASPNMTIFLLEWIISLRKIGNYKGKIIILDYGIDVYIKKAISVFDVRFIECLKRKTLDSYIVNTRYIDIIPILEEDQYYNYIVAHFDVDIWFQDDINDVFLYADTINGCLFASEMTEARPYRGPENEKIKSAMEKKYDLLYEKYSGHINGGFVCGNIKKVTEKLKKFKELISNLFFIPDFGTDQFAFNYLFDDKKDKADGYKWNCVPKNAIFKNGYWYTKEFKNYKSEKASAFHCYGNIYPNLWRNKENTRFHILYNDLFKKALDEINLEYNTIMKEYQENKKNN